MSQAIGWLLEDPIAVYVTVGIVVSFVQHFREMKLIEKRAANISAQMQKPKIMMMTRSLKMAVLGFGLICSTELQAKCSCQCFNGWMRSVCSGPGDTVPATCPAQACAVTGPTVLPVQPPQVPPPGTSVCKQQGGRNVCR